MALVMTELGITKAPELLQGEIKKYLEKGFDLFSITKYSFESNGSVDITAFMGDTEDFAEIRYSANSNYKEDIKTKFTYGATIKLFLRYSSSLRKDASEIIERLELAI